MNDPNNRLDNTIDLAACYAAILLDVAAVYPQDQLDWVRDSKRIHQQSSRRGLSFFTIELPRIGKELDRSLSRGSLELGGLAFTRRCRPGSKIPKLFQGLWKRIFNDDGCLREDADANAVFFLRTLLYCAKKVKIEAPESTLFEKTKEFYHAEEHLPPAPEVWDLQSPIRRDQLGHLGDLAVPDHWTQCRSQTRGARRIDRLLDSVQQIADRVSGELGDFNPDLIVGRHGPGAVSELPTTKYKYDFGVWSPNLEYLFPSDRHAHANLSFVEDLHREVDFLVREEASRLIPVPKDQRGPRLIAAEPLSHQWIQGGLSEDLRSRIPNTILGNCINFFDQRPSMVSALEASASGLQATVDLKSASDNLSCYVVQRFFRANLRLLELMRACRTRFLTNRVDPKQQTLLRLRKFATMGSALTFPVQSIVFAMICLGVGRIHEPHRSWHALARKVRVFGDDIIVPKHWVADLSEVLTTLRLEVNHSKTFSEGNFRESCGMDAFRGVDVTPPYVKCPRQRARNSGDVASILDVANNFWLKGYWHTAEWMRRADPRVFEFPVVHLSSGVSGHMSFCKGVRNDENPIMDLEHLNHQTVVPRTRRVKGVWYFDTGSALPHRIRWNRQLQRTEVRLPTLNYRGGGGTSRSDGSSILLEWFIQKLSRSSSRVSSAIEDDLRMVSIQGADLEGRLQHLDFLRSRLGAIYSRSRPDLDERQVKLRLSWVPLQSLVGLG